MHITEQTRTVSSYTLSGLTKDELEMLHHLTMEAKRNNMFGAGSTFGIALTDINQRFNVHQIKESR